MLSKNHLFSSSYASSSFSSSSSSSQLTTPRAFQNLLCPRLSSQEVDLSPTWDLDLEKTMYNNSCTMPKSSDELVREIRELDTKILNLERCILSLYRTSFGYLLPKMFLDDSLPCLKTSPLKPFTAKFRKDRENLQDTDKRSESGNPSLADLLGLKTPEKLSEEY